MFVSLKFEILNSEKKNSFPRNVNRTSFPKKGRGKHYLKDVSDK